MGAAEDIRGLKRVCASCGMRFYDMNKRPIICPGCGTEFNGEIKAKARRSKAVTAEEKPKAANQTQDDTLHTTQDDDVLEADNDDIVSLDDVEDINSEDDDNVADPDMADLDSIDDIDDIDEDDDDLDDDLDDDDLKDLNG